jgi:hypothetical protein
VAQKGGGVLRIGKGGAKELVVRLVQGFVRHTGAHPADDTAGKPRGVVFRGRSGRFGAWNGRSAVVFRLRNGRALIGLYLMQRFYI